MYTLLIVIDKHSNDLYSFLVQSTRSLTLNIYSLWFISPQIKNIRAVLFKYLRYLIFVEASICKLSRLQTINGMSMYTLQAFQLFDQGMKKICTGT